jgi:predicted MFS family arabinose efflux permease
VYFAAGIVALNIPPDDPARLPPAALEREELQSPKIRFAAGAMAVLRGAIGFLVFLVAFGLKRAGEPTWFFGAIAAVSVAGGLAGTLVSPVLRRRIRRDEPVITVALLTAAVVSLGAAAAHASRASVAAGVFAVALAASMGRQGFDSILQRDAPAAARGRSFARFETLFQLVWVLGALGGVVLQPSNQNGLALLGVVFALTLVTYVIGSSRRRFPRAPRAETAV